MSQFFLSGGQSTRVSYSATVLPMNIQDWFPLGFLPFHTVQGVLKARIPKVLPFPSPVDHVLSEHGVAHVTVVHVISLIGFL